MTAPARRRLAVRVIHLDRSLEALPFFRLSDSSDEGPISYSPGPQTRWRVIAAPGERLPGTFDQDVYIEIFRRFGDAGFPHDGVVTFTLHDFLRSMGRRVDGRTYEQLRFALGRLERTTLESNGAFWDAAAGSPLQGSLTVLSTVRIERRRQTERVQLGLFPAIAANEPGDARVTVSSIIRTNIAAGNIARLDLNRYLGLSSPVARRLYRMVGAASAQGSSRWELPLPDLAQRLPLAQRFPSHLQRVLEPANAMLVAAGIVRSARIRQDGESWLASYTLLPGPPSPAAEADAGV
jgi:plasmid replication initiation protein